MLVLKEAGLVTIVMLQTMQLFIIIINILSLFLVFACYCPYGQWRCSHLERGLKYENM